MDVITLQYQIKDHRIVASGRGIAAVLVKRFIDYASDQGWTVKLMCPYATQQFKLHPEYQRLLLPEDRF